MTDKTKFKYKQETTLEDARNAFENAAAAYVVAKAKADAAKAKADAARIAANADAAAAAAAAAQHTLEDTIEAHIAAIAAKNKLTNKEYKNDNGNFKI